MARRYLQEFDKGAHNVHLLYYHLVIVTKYRQKILDTSAINRVISIFKGIGNLDEYNVVVEQAQGEPDHIHFLLRVNTSTRLSKFIGVCKSLSSRVLKEEGYLVTCSRSGAVWSPSYCLLTTGGAPIDVIRRYIEGQGKSKTPAEKARVSDEKSI